MRSRRYQTIVKNSDGVNVSDEGASGRRNIPTKIQYRRLRAPRENGETLQSPPLKDAAKFLEQNVQSFAESRNVVIGEMRLSQLSRLGRKEVFDLARKHTEIYRDTSLFANRDIGLDRIVMSGHQPTLFHPGVWYKNFALSALGTSFGCVAINLIVDNDICGVAAISAPSVSDDSASIKMLHFDAPGDNIPFEARGIEDRAIFDSFDLRVKKAIAPVVDLPLVDQLWKFAKNFHQPETRLGETLAASRHALEIDLGLETLEVPLSQVAQTEAFARFTQHLLEHVEAFRSIYNRALLEYRTLHKIRSRSHPVPPLEVSGEWSEAPFWIWNTDQPVRGRLFTRISNGTIKLTNRQDIHVSIEKARFVEQFCDLTARGIAVRPRAITTTMFSRLVLSDLFLHGIGGAKYDQLTDVIIEGFFGIVPPVFMTLTATMKLPTDYENITHADIVRVDQQLRELTFHPEAFISQPNSVVRELAARKLEWIGQNLPKGERLKRHRAIEDCNERLQPYVESQRQNYQLQRDELPKKIRTSQILGSREFSFCLFPIELVDQLKMLAR